MEVQGVPAGAIATPIATPPLLPRLATEAGAPTSMAAASPPPQVQGVPEGAIATPLSQSSPQETSLLQSTVDAINKIPGIQQATGFMKSAEQGAAGLLEDVTTSLDRPLPIGDAAQRADPNVHLLPENIRRGSKAASDWLRKNTETHGFWEKSGSVAELVTELMHPSSAAEARGMSIAEWLSEAAKNAKILEGSPKIARLVARGLESSARTGLEMGAQAAVHTGGDADETLKSLEEGALIGGPLAIVGDLAVQGADSYLKTRRIADEAKAAAEAADRVPTPPPKLTELPEKPTLKVEQPDATPAERFAEQQRLMAQGAVENNDAVAARHLENLNNIVRDPEFKKYKLDQKAEVTRLRREMMDHLSQGTAPSDSSELISQIGDIGQAAEALRAAPEASRARLNEMSEGRYETIDNDLRKLEGKNDQESMLKRNQLNAELEAMLSLPKFKGMTSPALRALHRSQEMSAEILEGADDAFNKAFSGAGKTGKLDAEALQKNWRNFVNERGVPEVRDALGRERYEAMNDFVNELATEPTPEAIAKEKFAQDTATYKEAVAKNKEEQAAYDRQESARLARVEAANRPKPTVMQKAKSIWSIANAVKAELGIQFLHYLPVPAKAKAIAGGSVVMGYVLKRILANPTTARILATAIREGGKPEVYGPVISAILRKQRDDERQKGGAIQ